MDKLFMYWCFTHGWDPLVPQAEEEYGLWCAESDAFGDVDIDEEGVARRFSSKDCLAACLQLVEREQSVADGLALGWLQDKGWDPFDDDTWNRYCDWLGILDEEWREQRREQMGY